MGNLGVFWKGPGKNEGKVTAPHAGGWGRGSGAPVAATPQDTPPRRAPSAKLNPGAPLRRGGRGRAEEPLQRLRVQSTAPEAELV